MQGSVASRLLALLGAFDAKHTSLTLSDLARRADLPVATAHRLAGELVAWGALAHTPIGTYEIGLRVWDLGLLAPMPSRLRQTASPFLQDLYAATLATVHLGVREGTQVLYLDRLSGSELPPISHVGARLPLHTTGIGKVLLAYAPEDVLGSVLANLTRVTRYTITDPDKLTEQLLQVRTEGYAYTREEMSLRACSLAVPVRDRDGEVPAALGLTVSSLDRNTTQLVAALTVAANGIRRSLASTIPTLSIRDDRGPM
ncbi:MAG: IclR family transcriptional regulator [Acidimicrobiaceae bacterium]|nr:IclR family transcriptional regulator [Acidimicrobiaceae bacterium]